MNCFGLAAQEPRRTKTNKKRMGEVVERVTGNGKLSVWVRGMKFSTVDCRATEQETVKKKKKSLIW